MVSYGYSTHAQHEAAANNASRSCRSYDARARQVNTIDNADGTRTVTFTCDQPL